MRQTAFLQPENCQLESTGPEGHSMRCSSHGAWIVLRYQSLEYVHELDLHAETY